MSTASDVVNDYLNGRLSHAQAVRDLKSIVAAKYVALRYACPVAYEQIATQIDEAERAREYLETD